MQAHCHHKIYTSYVMYNKMCCLFPLSAPSIKVAILPGHILQVMWLPADDINRSSISYVLNTSSADANKIISRNFTCPNTTITLTELSNIGTVSLQAQNHGALSEPVRVAYRMVNITVRVARYNDNV